MDETDWATSLVGCVKRALELKRGDGEGVYAGVIVGGCCKAGPDSISALRRICMEQELL
jgi:homocysteine S-methyltransferase